MAIYDFYAQDLERDIIKQISPYIENKIFIDVGAEKGAFAHLLCELGMTGALIEPLPKHHPDLNKIINKYKGTRLFACAITDIDTRQLFHIACNNDQELDYFHSLQKADSPGVFIHSKSFEVECRSLQSMVTHREIPENIGLLKIDTEGNDLNVLRGLGDIRPEVIICEFFTNGLYDGWPDGNPEQLIDYMLKLGYLNFLSIKHFDELTFVSINAEQYQDRQWGNLFFFRKDLYNKIEPFLTATIFCNQNIIIEKFKKINFELVEKEKVIQQLLQERRANCFDEGLSK